MKKRANIKTIIVCLIFIFLIFEQPISYLLPGSAGSLASYADELLAIFLFMYGLLKRRFNKHQKVILGALLALIGVGLMGTAVHHLQPFHAVIEDVVSTSKFFLALFGAYALMRKSDGNKTIKSLQKITKIIVYSFFILTVIGYVFAIQYLLFDEVRFGIKSLSLLYYHPAVLSYVLTAFLAVLSVRVDGKKHFLEKIMCAIMLILTLRAKSIAFGFVYLLVDNYAIISKTIMRKALSIILITAAVVMVAKDSIMTYYGGAENSARGRITSESITIMYDEFPIGYGYATYGGAAAAKYYSPVYKRLHFDEVYGLGYVNTKYATDTFWPVIIAEFGSLGLIIYSVFLLRCCSNGYKLLKKKNKYAYLFMIPLLYMIIVSTSSSSFLNPVIVLYSVLMSMGMNEMEV